MARKRYNRRRRRGRYSFLLKLFGFLIAAAAMFAAVTLFFRMDHIVVRGNERYSEQEVLAASGLETGGNLYLLNKFDVKETIFRQLPYVEEIKINRKLPDTLLIEIRECKAVAGIADGDGVWLISDRGKLLERSDAPAEGCPLITGGELIDPAPTGTANMGPDMAYRLGVVMTLLSEADARRMRGNINAIDLADDTAVNLIYLSRFTVRFPWTADVGYKLESLGTVADYLENNETGLIDLMTEGKASFIPQ